MTIATNSPLRIEDFSGGKTDLVVGRPSTLSGALRNMVIQLDHRPKVRPGSESDGGTDAIAKLTSGVYTLGVEHMASSLTSGEKPYKFTTERDNTPATNPSYQKGKIFYHNGTTHVELTGPSGNSLFTTAHGAATDTRFTAARWNDQIFATSCSMTQKPRRLFINAAGALSLRTLGLPKYDGTVTYVTAGTVGTYLYAFVWKHTYTVGGRTYIDRSDPLIVSKTNIYASLTFTAGALNNTGGESYFAQAASANESLVLEVYRTITLGNILYYVGSCDYANLATGVTDGIIDGTLDDSTTIYTTGGFPGRVQVPICKFAHVTEDGTGYYGYVNDGSNIFKNRVQQSLPGVPGSTAATFFSEMSDDLAGISSYKAVPIFFGKTSIYRGEGKYSIDGTGSFLMKKVIDGVGCINHNSIVQTFAGVFFSAKSGFYWTDGFNVKKISDEINPSFADAYSTEAEQFACEGAFDEDNLLVYWTAPETATSDQIFVFHLRFGIKENGVFTDWGGMTSENSEELFTTPTTLPTTITQNFQAKCILWENGVLYRGDDRGYTFTFDESAKTDPRVVPTTNISSWGTTYIHYRWESVALDFGSAMIRKWTAMMSVVFKNNGDLSVRPKIERDLNEDWRDVKEIKARTAATWGAAGVLWGDEVLWASEAGLFIYERRFPARGLRCTYRTVALTNSFTVIQKSDNLGKAEITPAVSPGVGTATLLSGEWPDDVLDYYFCTKADDYQRKYLITGRTATVLTLSDASGVLPVAGDYKWEIRGYAKGHILEIESVTLPFMPMSDSQLLYRSGTEGNNA